MFNHVFVYYLMLSYFLLFFLYNVFKVAYRTDGPSVKSIGVDITLGNVTINKLMNKLLIYLLMIKADRVNKCTYMYMRYKYEFPGAKKNRMRQTIF